MKLIPETLMSIKGGMQLVVRTRAIPPSARTANDAPIVPNCTLVVCDLANGETRYFGVDSAHITPSLRMAVDGGFVNAQNELTRNWEVAQ